MKKIVFALTALALLGVLAVLWSFQDPVRPERLARLQPGMTRAEVEAALGPPTRKLASGQWTYSRPLVFGYVNIHWQPDGTFQHANYERY